MGTNWVGASGPLEEMSFIPGSVCWIEVSTTDPAASRDFYAGLFGWVYQVTEAPGSGQHSTALCGGRPVAGLVGVPAQAKQLPAWMPYLASANIAHTAAAFNRWGGRTLYGPADVAGQGTVFIGSDPTGGVIGFWQPDVWWTFGTDNPGALFWAELNTWDGVAADEFFVKLFGYRTRQIGDGVEVDYTTWSRNGRVLLGRLQMNQDWAAPGTAAHWLLHFAVDPRSGTDAAVARVVELGGRLDIGPYDSELGRIAQVADPTGAVFALIDPTTRLATATDLAAGPARVDDPYDD